MQKQSFDEKACLAQATKLSGEFDRLRLAKEWSLVTDKEGSRLFKKERPDVCPFACYMINTVINKPKEEVVAKVWGINEAGAKKNDPKLISWRKVHDGDKCKVLSQFNATGPLMWQRHMVFSQVRIDEKDSTKLVGFSVDHSDAPTDEKNYVRAHMHMSVWEFKEKDKNTTEVTRIAQVDPRGNIPVWLVSWYAGNMLDMPNRWKE